MLARVRLDLATINGQIAVDSTAPMKDCGRRRHAVIHRQQANAARAGREQTETEARADAGYFSGANVTDAVVTGSDLCVASGRDQHGNSAETTVGDAPTGATPP